MRNRIDLCGEWDFRPLYGVEGDISLPETEGKFEKITVPSLWRSNWFEYRNGTRQTLACSAGSLT